MSVGENVGFGLKMRGVDKATIKKKVAEMLELVQLPGVEDRRPKQLSGRAAAAYRPGAGAHRTAQCTPAR